MPISLATIEVVSLFGAASLYGVYTVLFFGTLTVFLRRRRTERRPQMNPLLLLTVPMYCLSTADVALALYATIHLCLRLENDHVPFTTANFYQDLGGLNVFLAQGMCQTINCLFADIILVWRVWVVWGRNYWIATVPALALVGEFLTGILAVNSQQSIAKGTYNIPGLVPVASSLLLVVNVLCTTLIAGRIMYAMRMRRLHEYQAHDGLLMSALLVILESGFIYSASWLVALVLSLTGSQAWQIVMKMNTQLSGITPTVIVVLSHLNKLSESALDGQTQQTSTIQFRSQSTPKPASEPYRLSDVEMSRHSAMQMGTEPAVAENFFSQGKWDAQDI